MAERRIEVKNGVSIVNKTCHWAVLGFDETERQKTDNTVQTILIVLDPVYNLALIALHERSDLISSGCLVVGEANQKFRMVHDTVPKVSVVRSMER